MASSNLKNDVVRIFMEMSEDEFNEVLMAILDVCGTALRDCDCIQAADTRQAFFLLKKLHEGKTTSQN